MDGSLIDPSSEVLVAPGVRGTRTELALDDNVTLDEWKKIVRAVLGHGDSANWWLGDALVHGEWHYGEKYTLFLAETELSHGHLRNCAYVCANVPPALRRVDLSWTHHVAVAKLPPAEQRHWLEKAAEERWTVAQLKAALAGETVESSLRNDKWRLAVTDKERLEQWSRAAALYDLAVQEWAVRTLDEAAAAAGA